MIPTEVKILPEALSLNRKGKFTVFMALPHKIKTKKLDSISFTCEGAPAMKGIRKKGGFIAKFDTRDLLNISAGKDVTFTATAIFSAKDCTRFAFKGSDTVCVYPNLVNPSKCAKHKRHHNCSIVGKGRK